MAFHVTNLGRFGEQLRPYADALGYVPERGDECPAGYSKEEWAERVEAAERATERAVAAVERWRRDNL